MGTLRNASIFVMAIVGIACAHPSSASNACSPCPAGMSVQQLCNDTADTACIHCQPGTFSATASHRKQCNPCSRCPIGMYVEKPCQSVSNTICSPCSRCPIGMYVEKPCQSVSDTICSPCSRCPIGMYVEKPCQSVSNTICSPCSRIPRVESDFFLTSCKGMDSSGTRPDHDFMMMSDSAADTPAHRTEDDPVKLSRGSQDSPGHEHSEHHDNTDNGFSQNGLGNVKDANDGIGHAEDSMAVADNSAKETTHTTNQTDKYVKDNVASADTEKAEGVDDLETIKSEKVAAMPFAPSDDSLIDTTKSTHEHFSLDEGSLDAVKFAFSEEASNNKRDMNVNPEATPLTPDEEDISTTVPSERNDTGEISSRDRELSERTQSDTPNKQYPHLDDLEAVYLDSLSKMKTDPPTADNSSDVADGFSNDKPRTQKVQDEDSEGRKRAAIILGVAIGGLVLFALVFFASRCCKRRRRRQFKEMKKVPSCDTEEAELQPLSYSDPGSHGDPDNQTTNGLYRQGPPVGPSSPRKKQPEVEKLPPPDVQVAPETSITVPVLTASPVLDDLPESLSDQESLATDTDKFKYIDESTDDEYVMRILNKIPFSRLSHVLEESSTANETTPQT